jgi:hypothetical protein
LGFASFSFSFSSSLSPRLKGSFSATGEGSTLASGCHLLGLPPVEMGRLEVDEASYRLSISVGGPSWKETLRLSGEGDDPVLMLGRGGRGGGASATVR